MKVRLVRGMIWRDKETGFSIRKGEIKEASEDILKRAGNRLQALIELDEVKVEEEKVEGEKDE